MHSLHTCALVRLCACMRVCFVGISRLRCGECCTSIAARAFPRCPMPIKAPINETVSTNVLISKHRHTHTYIFMAIPPSSRSISLCIAIAILRLIAFNHVLSLRACITSPAQCIASAVTVAVGQFLLSMFPLPFPVLLFFHFLAFRRHSSEFIVSGANKATEMHQPPRLG